MKNKILRLLATSVALLLFFVIQKPLFMLVYLKYYHETALSDWLNVIWHGLPLDISVVGYVAILPTLILLLDRIAAMNPKAYDRFHSAYYALIGVVIMSIFIGDMALYEHWGFRLDTTPFIYIQTSPAKAMASTPVWMLVGGFVLLLIACWAFWFVMYRKVYLFVRKKASHEPMVKPSVKVLQVLLCVLLLGIEFLMIRGSVTVSSQNTGRAYFSNDIRLNHAAVNPAFSLLESMSHDNDFANQYRFMDDEAAATLFAAMADKGDTTNHTDTLFTTTRPNVIIVMMESFSTQIMESFDGEKNVTPNLDRIAQEGILFTNFYANSFRTDRGLASVLSGYPAQPTTSVMKYPHKTQNLPSIAHTLVDNGYTATYYFGGDADFTNRRSYLMASKYSTIIADQEFPVKLRMSKWGVPDEYVFERLLTDIKDGKLKNGNQYVTLQTSSSHEPFDVPYHRLDNERLNAFAYTDDCIGKFIDEFSKLPEWRNTVVVFVADHLGCWPVEIDNYKPYRYHIPLVITGGAITGQKRIDVLGSQHDLAATLLAQMGISHEQFTFSKDMLNPDNPHFAFFTVPDAFGMKTKDGCVIYDNKAGQCFYTEGSNNDQQIKMGQAYLQKLYDDLAER